MIDHSHVYHPVTKTSQQLRAEFDALMASAALLDDELEALAVESAEFIERMKTPFLTTPKGH